MCFEAFLGDLKGLRCVSEAIETFPGKFDFPLDISASEGAIVTVNWLVVKAASINIIANCINSRNSSTSQISSSLTFADDCEDV